MLKVKLVAENNIMTVKEYHIQYPFSVVTNNDDITQWNLNSFHCKNVKGSFRLTYSYMVSLDDLSPTTALSITNGNPNLKDLDPMNCTRIADNTSVQKLLFTRHLLFYINEKDPTINTDKKIFPHFLLLKENDAKKRIQFFVSYEDQRIKIVDDEEITFYLNLFRE